MSKHTPLNGNSPKSSRIPRLLPLLAVGALQRLQAVVISALMIAGISTFVLPASSAQAADLLDVGTTIDEQGPDDVTPARTDLSSMSFDGSHAALPPTGEGIIYVRWNYDDTYFTEGSINACGLFDTDEDGEANYAVCAEVGYDGDSAEPNVGVIRDVDLWDCSDQPGHLLNCWGSAGDGSGGELGDKDNDGINDSTATGSANERWVTDTAPGYDTTCTLTINDDPFATNAVHLANDSTANDPSAGGEAPDPINDIVITCAVHVSDLVEYDTIDPTSTIFPKGTHEGGDANLTNVCSYPATSGEPGSNAKDCVVSEGAAFITIVKNIDGGTPDDMFDFTLDGSAFASITTSGGTGSTLAIPTAAGTYNLAEVADTEWELLTATCSDGSDPAALVLSSGERVTCTFTNTLAFTPAPAIDLLKSFSGFATDGDADDSGGVSEGDTLNYNFVVTNIGNVDLSNVTVTDPLITELPNSGSISCPKNTLSTDPDGVAPFNGESITCTATYLVTPGDFTYGRIDNEATASGTDPDNEVVEDKDTETVPIPKLSVDKVMTNNADQDGSGTISLGDTLTYTITATNNGVVDLTDLLVTDDLTGDDTTCASVPAAINNDDVAGTCVLTGTHVVTQADVDKGVINNTGAADSNETGQVSDPENVLVPQISVLLNAKTLLSNADEDNSGTVSLNDTLTYQFVATNDGNQTLTGVTIVDPLPGLSTLSCDQAQPATLAPGAALTCTATYVVTEADVTAGVINNTATADSDQTDPVPASETVPVPNTGTVTGTVFNDIDGDGIQDPGEAGIPNIGVEITDSQGDTQTVTTDANGDYSATVPAGATTINVDETDADLPVGSALTTQDPTTVTVPAGGTASDSDGFQQQGTVTGTVFNDIDGDGIQDPGEAGIPNIGVEITDSQGDTQTVTTDANGDYSATVPAGATTINVDETDADLPVGSALTTQDPTTVTVPAGGTASDSDGFQQQGTVTGTVFNDIDGDGIQDPGEAGIPNIGVEITDSQGDTQTVTTDANGDYSATVPAGATTINVDETDADLPVGSALTTQDPTTVTVPAGGTASDSDGFQQQGDVFGHIFEDTNGDGIQQAGEPDLGGVDVVVTDSLGNSQTVTTDDNGDYSATVPAGSTTADVDESTLPEGVDVQTAGVDPSTVNVPAGSTTDIGDDGYQPRNPELSIDKVYNGFAPAGDADGSGDVSEGDTLSYTITATNSGNVDLNGVVVSDDLTGDFTGDGTNLACVDPLTPTATCVLNTTYVVTGLVTPIDNIGTADSDQTDPETDTASVVVPQPSLAIDKVYNGFATDGDADGSGDVSVGDTLSYTITATNTGTANLTGVSVSDNLTGANTSCALVLAADNNVGVAGTCVLNTTYVVTGLVTPIDNIGTADSDQTDPETDTASVVVPQPSLAIDKVYNGFATDGDADGSGDVSVGDTLSYTITATNTGTANLTGVSVSDNLTGANTSCALVLAADNNVGVAGTCVLNTTYVVTGLVTPIDNIGTADSDQTDPETDTASVVVPQPSLAIDKVYNGFATDGDADGSGDVSVGDTLSYTITATNTGTANLTGVSVSDNLTGANTSCALVLAADNNVGVAGTCVLNTTYVVTGLVTPIDNIGTADSDQTDPETDTASVVVPQPSLAIDKVYNGFATDGDADGSGDVSVGDTLSYTITATNTGTANLTGVSVSDNLTGANTSCALVLAADNNVGVAGTCVLNTTYVVTGLVTPIDNIGTADSDQTDPETDTASVVVPQPSLAIDKVYNGFATDGDADGSGDVSVGDTLSYTITATNTGTANLTGVSVSDNLTGANTSCALVLAADNNVGVAGTCVLNTTYVVTGLVTPIDNIGTADSDQTDPETDTASVVVPQPSLAIDKVYNGFATDGDADGSGDVSVGDTLSYTITATNTGTANLTGVSVSDNLTGANTSCALVLAADNNVGVAGTCVLNTTYVVTGLVTPIDNIGTADSDQTDPETDTASVVVPQPSLAIDKVYNGFATDGDADGSGDVSVGDTLSYTITATNTGTANLTGVSVSDNLTGANTSCALVLAADNNVGVAGTCVLNTTYVVTGLVTPIDNIGTADSDQTDPETDTASVVVPQPSLAIDKVYNGFATDGDADGSGDVSVGDTLSYTITATNTGTANLTGVSVSDNLTGANTSCALVLAADNNVGVAGTCVLNTTYVVTGLVTPIDNIGTADSDQTDPETDTASVVVPQPSLAIDKVYNGFATDGDADGSGDVSVGDTLSYTITATNTGTANLTGVSVSDNLTGANTSCALVLAADNNVGVAGTCVLNTTYVVTGLVTPIDNIGTADSDQTDPETDTASVVVPQPSLAIDKVYNGFATDGDADGSGDVSVGDTLSYTITATNTGTANLTGVSVSDNLTGANTSCALVLAADNNVGVAGTCVLNTTYVVTGLVTPIDNIGTADSDQTDPETDTASVVVPQPSLAIDKVYNGFATDGDADGSGDVSVGDTLSYTITATNTGTANLTGVSVSDNLTGANTSCALVLAADNNVGVAGTCVLNTTYVVTGLVTPIDNIGTADSDQTDPETDTASVVVPQPSLAIDKVYNGFATDGDADGSGDVSVGDTLSYTITATNTGTANLTGVSVSDNLTGANTSCALVLAADNNVGVAGTCVLNTTYVVTGLVTPIDNIGTADSDQTDPETDTASVVVPQPSLAIDKVYNGFATDGDADGSGDVSVGDTLSYTITATNTGTANLTGVSVSDNLTGANTSCALVLAADNNVGVAGTCVLNTTYVVTGLVTPIDNIGTADSDQTDPETDTASVVVPQPSLAIDKVYNGFATDGDADGSGDVSVGDTLSYTITATNTGTANLTGVSVSDNLTGANTSCALVLAADNNVGVAGTCVLNTTYVVMLSDIATMIANTGTADSVQTDPKTDTVKVDVPQSDLSISKDDGVTEITAGDGFTYTYTITVTNTPLALGGANMTSVMVSDTWPADTVFAQGTVTPSQGTCSAGPDFSCNLGIVLTGGSATVTVSYTVPSSTPAGSYTNSVTVAAPQDFDTSNNTDYDTNEVITDIDLSITKTFVPASVPQGTAQRFTIEVSNAGPSDAVDVSVTDLVHDSLAVTGVSVTSGSGDCSASVGQQVDCTVQIPAGQSVLITVDYVTAPFSNEISPYGTVSGDDFRFVFENGSVLEGSTDGGPVYLDGVDITADVEIVIGLTKNDIVFDPPGDDPAFELHLSCSDPFTGGWGQSGGPVEGVDTNWQIAFFTIARYQNGDFRKTCGNVVNPFDVPNTATAEGEDSSGTETVSDDATVTIEPGITLDKLQTNGKRLTVRLTNFTGEAKEVKDISVEWPGSNGNLFKIRLDDVTTWTGSEPPPTTLLDATDVGWNGGTLLTGEGILRFDFVKKSARIGYTIRLNFTDGTFLDIGQ